MSEQERVVEVEATRHLVITPINQGVGKDRVTLTLSVVHEHAGDEPQQSGGLAWTYLSGNELEPEGKRRKLTEDWQPFRFGDLEPEQVGIIVVQSLVGRGRETNPTEEEREADAAKIIQIGIKVETNGISMIVPILEIAPGFPQHFLSPDPSSLRVRCVSGEALARVTVHPR